MLCKHGLMCPGAPVTTSRSAMELLACVGFVIALLPAWLSSLHRYWLHLFPVNMKSYWLWQENKLNKVFQLLLRLTLEELHHYHIPLCFLNLEDWYHLSLVNSFISLQFLNYPISILSLQEKERNYNHFICLGCVKWTQNLRSFLTVK